MIGRVLKQAVTIEHRSRTGHDSYGSETLSTVSTTTTRGDLQVQKEKEEQVREDVLRATWQLVLPASVNIAYTDRVIVGEQTFEVIDVREVVRARTGRRHHWLVRLMEDV